MQHLTNGATIAEVDGSTVGECLQYLVEHFPSIEKELFDKTSEVLAHIDIYVNGWSIYPEEMAKAVKDGDELNIVPIIAGG